MRIFFIARHPFPSLPYLSFSSLPYPTFSLFLSPLLMKLSKLFIFRLQPLFSLFLYFLYSIYLPQRILLVSLLVAVCRPTNKTNYRRFYPSCFFNLFHKFISFIAHADKYILNLGKSNQIWIVITFIRLIWHHMELPLVS